MRSYLRARLIGLVALASATLGIGQDTNLERFANRDFLTNRLTRTEREELARMTGELPSIFGMSGAGSWHIWKQDDRYILLSVESEVIIPGGSGAHILLFDRSAKRIGTWSFQTGWRMTPRKASFQFSDLAGCDLITLEMARFINGGDVSKEHYAVVNNRVLFVRMENEAGEAVQNDYIYPNYEIGVVPNAESPDQWQALLESDKPAEVLAALVFLGGRHMEEPRRRFESSPSSSKYATLFAKLIDDRQIRASIEKLTTSSHKWIREAAILAARGPTDRRID